MPHMMQRSIFCTCWLMHAHGVADVRKKQFLVYVSGRFEYSAAPRSLRNQVYSAGVYHASHVVSSIGLQNTVQCGRLASKTTACGERQESVCHRSWMFRYVPNQGMQRLCSLIPSSKRFRRLWKSLRIQGLWSVAGAPNAIASAADSPPMTGSSAFMCILRSLWRPFAPSAGVPRPAFTHHMCSSSLQSFRKHAMLNCPTVQV